MRALRIINETKWRRRKTLLTCGLYASEKSIRNRDWQKKYACIEFFNILTIKLRIQNVGLSMLKLDNNE